MTRISSWLSLLAMALISMNATAGEVIYYHNDLSGSPVAATNQSGQVIWRESYRPYGERLTNSAAASGNKIWFTSRRQDAETGLVYMGARYYDPVTGRFISTDPKIFDEANIHSFNRFAYANNNPYKYIDLDGKEAFVIFHPAVWNSMSNPTGLFHASVLLKPDIPADFSNRTGWRSDRDGGIYATLGGQPNIDLASGQATLVSAPNYRGDQPEKSWARIKIERPAGMTDTEFIDALIRAADLYKNDKPYALAPKDEPGSYNSNSFVSGVVKAAGGEPPALPVAAPGYDRPLPLP